MARPECGVNIPDDTPSEAATVTGTVSALLAIAGAAAKIAGITTVSGAFWGGVAVGAAITVIVGYFAYQRCKTDWGGEAGCMTGVIESITLAFSGNDVFLSFMSQHDRVDVVVKSVYWDLIAAQSSYVFCSARDDSPIIPAFYYNSAVCWAGAGGVIGAAAGVAIGAYMAAAAIAAIGCASVILCIIALIVAALIVAAVTIVGAIMGSGIAAQIADTSSGPALTNDPSSLLRVGEYVTIQGNLMKNDDLNGALVFYFATKTSGYGFSMNQPSFSYTDPDQNIPDSMDICQPGTVLF
jgi:hypothetical protein